MLLNRETNPCPVRFQVLARMVLDGLPRLEAVPRQASQCKPAYLSRRLAPCVGLADLPSASRLSSKRWTPFQCGLRLRLGLWVQGCILLLEHGFYEDNSSIYQCVGIGAHARVHNKLCNKLLSELPAPAWWHEGKRRIHWRRVFLGWLGLPCRLKGNITQLQASFKMPTYFIQRSRKLFSHLLCSCPHLYAFLRPWGLIREA
mmetsp:Transcript_35974/g.66091  ORF Transcript_35974/g.66091 Transcript_35974/m.66091 type:complete len:202 (+) Transcript_35974:372-977(+)